MVYEEPNECSGQTAGNPDAFNSTMRGHNPAKLDGQGPSDAGTYATRKICSTANFLSPIPNFTPPREALKSVSNIGLQYRLAKWLTGKAMDVKGAAIRGNMFTVGMGVVDVACRATK